MNECDLFKTMSPYGRLSSWAVWGDIKPTKPFTYSSTLTFPIDNPELYNIVKADTVFVGMNPGGKIGINSIKDYHRITNEPIENPYRNFHVGGKHNDHLLAEALRDTPWWGAYMTDLFPFPTSESSCLKSIVNDNPEQASSWIKEFNDEMVKLGRNELKLACLGTFVKEQVDKWLVNPKTRLQNVSINYKVLYLPHYSGLNSNKIKSLADEHKISWVSMDYTYPKVIKKILTNGWQ